MSKKKSIISRQLELRDIIGKLYYDMFRILATEGCKYYKSDNCYYYKCTESNKPCPRACMQYTCPLFSKIPE